MTQVTDEELYQLVVDTGQSQAKLNQVADAADKAERAITKAGGSSKNAGQAMTQLGYAVDDIQSGFRGISNNIQPLLQSLGASGGLAAAFSIAAIAANQLYTHWDDLMRAFGMGTVKTQAEQMEELGKKTAKTAEETQKLLKFQEQQATIQSQRKAKSGNESAQASIVGNAIAEMGQQNLVRSLVQINRARYENSPENHADIQTEKSDTAESAELQKILKHPGQHPPALYTRARMLEERAKAARERINTRVNEMAEKQLADAASDPGALNGLVNQVIANKGAFGKDANKFAASLMSGLPENLKAQEENDRIGRKADESKKQSVESARREAASRKEKDDEAEYEWQKLEDSNRSWKQSKQQRDRAQREQEMVRRQVFEQKVDTANRNDPNLQGMLSSLMLDAAQSGGPEAANTAAKDLIAKLSPKYGADVATKLVGDASVDAKRDYVGGLLEGPKERRSAVMGGADFAKAVQSGVTNTGDKQLRELQAINQQLKRILDRPNGLPP